MATGWIIKRNNKENGPFSAQQLKKFATSGKLKPDDWIRKESGNKFQKAQSVKGLFPEESLVEASAGDSADIGNMDLSAYGDLPMEDDDYGDEDYGDETGRPSRSKTKTPPRAGGKRTSKKSGGKSGKGKSKGKKNKVSYEDDPMNDLFWGTTLVGIAISALFYMDPETWELPEIMITVHEYTGRFGVSVVILLASLIFFIPAYQKIQRIQDKGQKIPWHLPTLGWLIFGIFGNSDEGGGEE